MKIKRERKYITSIVSTVAADYGARLPGPYIYRRSFYLSSYNPEPNSGVFTNVIM